MPLLSHAKPSHLSRHSERAILMLIIIVVAAYFTVSCRLKQEAYELQLEKTLESMRTSKSETPKPSTFKRAFDESLGFFDNIPEDLWLQRKIITQRHVHHPKYNYDPGPSARAWYQTNWEPDFVCFHEENVGGELDGHKWVCDPHRLNEKEDCLVYSFGSNGNFLFEKDLKRLAPHCDIHIFDPANFERRMKKARVNATYHTWGIKASYDRPTPAKSPSDHKYSPGEVFLSLQEFEMKKNKNTLKTLQETMQLLGHENRRIDVFKIDCEGCEWNTFKDFLQVDTRQILIEVHHVVRSTDDFFQELHDAGYVIFHKEPNIEFSGGDCVEVAFLKLAKEYFQPNTTVTEDVTD